MNILSQQKYYVMIALNETNDRILKRFNVHRKILEFVRKKNLKFIGNIQHSLESLNVHSKDRTFI